MYDGLLLLDKPAGCTSHDMVQFVRRCLRQKRIGHCGTLDPDATGLLLITAGKATRLTRFLIHAPKTYEGTIRLGVETDTYDGGGHTVAELPFAHLTDHDLAQAAKEFVGTQMQKPPRYSAKKQGGQRLYELARRGEEFEVEPKEVTVYAFSPTGPLHEGTFAFRLSCGPGTYARSVAHDLGQRLGCGGYLSSLRRITIGTFDVANALTAESIKERTATGAEPSELGGAWQSFDDIELPFRDLMLDSRQEGRALLGQTVLRSDLGPEEGDWLRLRNAAERFVAVGLVVERLAPDRPFIVQPKIVFS